MLMNVVRSVISIFLLVLLGLSIAGWMWAAGLPAPKQLAARLVLAVCSISAVGGMALIWSVKPRRHPG